MKKIIALSLCVVVLLVLASCGSKPTETVELDCGKLETLGDVFKLEKDGEMSTYNEKQYVNVFKYGGVYYRVYADLTEKLYNDIEAIDFFDENREQKTNDILGGVKIKLAENMTKYIPTEAELQKYVGKTGQELLDMGFWASGYSLWDDQVFFMGYEMCEFDVHFNEKIDVSDDMEDFDYEEAIKNLTVKTIEFTDFSGNTVDLDN